MRRPRGPGGRFLTADEVAAMEKDGKLENGQTPDMKPTNKSGSAKRKADSIDNDTPVKKSKIASESADEDDDEEGEDDLG